MRLCNLLNNLNKFAKTERIFLNSMYQKHKKIIVSTSCILINTILFGILIYKGNPIFATNDDYRMRLIISGEYSGTPNSQVVFLNILLSSILSKLYAFNPHIEWYGWYFELGIYLTTLAVSYIFLKRSREWNDFIKRFFLYFCVFMLLFQKQILMPQFTTVAAFFAMGAISCLLELRRSIYYDGVIKKKYTILLFVFVFLSYATRKKFF